jgi:hypothetical protein
MKLTEDQRAELDRFDQEHGIKHWDRSGRPMSMADWCEKFEDPSYKQIDKYQGRFCFVSTVWLGIDHGYGDKLLIFESMVFFFGHGIDCDRYTTIEEAREGHKRMVKEYAWRFDLWIVYLFKSIGRKSRWHK